MPERLYSWADFCADVIPIITKNEWINGEAEFSEKKL